MTFRNLACIALAGIFGFGFYGSLWAEGARESAQGANFQESRPEIIRLPSARNTRAIALRFSNGKKDVWVYPFDGPVLQSQPRPDATVEEVRSAWGEKWTASSKSELIFGRAFDVNLSEDGQRLYFAIPGMLGSSLYEYAIVNGRHRRIGKLKS